MILICGGRISDRNVRGLKNYALLRTVLQYVLINPLRFSDPEGDRIRGAEWPLY